MRYFVREGADGYFHVTDSKTDKSVMVFKEFIRALDYSEVLNTWVRL